MNSINEMNVQNAKDCFYGLYFALSREILAQRGKSGEKLIRLAVRAYGKKTAERLAEMLSVEGKGRNMKELFSSEFCGLADPRIQAECQHLDEAVALFNVFSCPFANMARRYDSEWAGQLYCEEFLHALVEEFSFSTAKISISDLLCNPEDDHCRIAAYLRAANMTEDQRMCCFAEKTDNAGGSAKEGTTVSGCREQAFLLAEAFYETCRTELGDEAAGILTTQGFGRAAADASDFLRTQAQKCGKAVDDTYLNQNSIFNFYDGDSKVAALAAIHYKFL